jgi:hypothetical protein
MREMQTPMLQTSTDMLAHALVAMIITTSQHDAPALQLLPCSLHAALTPSALVHAYYCVPAVLCCAVLCCAVL